MKTTITLKQLVEREREIRSLKPASSTIPLETFAQLVRSIAETLAKSPRTVCEYVRESLEAEGFRVKGEKTEGQVFKIIDAIDKKKPWYH